MALTVKKTSPDGSVYERDLYGLHATLADFDIAGIALKPSHIAWLKQLVSIIRSKGTDAAHFSWNVDLIGRASQTGGDDLNLWLSKERIRAVEEFLSSRLRGYSVRFNPTALGEFASQDWDDKEYYLDRSVEVQVTLKPAPRAVIPDPKVDPDPMEDFDMNVTAARLSAISLRYRKVVIPAGYAFVVINFNIQSMHDDTSTQYYFEGHGPATGVQPVGPAVWRGNKRHSFKANRKYHKRSFGGFARLSNYYSKGYRLQLGGSRATDWPRGTINSVHIPYPLVMWPSIASLDLTGMVRIGVAIIDEPKYEIE